MNFFLTFKWYTAFGKLDSEGFLKNLLGKSRAKNTMNFHSSTNDLVSFLFVS